MEDKGVVHVRTQVVSQSGALVCSFERKALVPRGCVANNIVASGSSSRPTTWRRARCSSPAT